MIFSVPGKTFLLGEYLALDGGPSILLSTEPRFELRIRSREAGLRPSAPFHPQSPAGRYYEKYRDDLNPWDYEFRDPSGGRGGLGASSAQFALLYAFHHEGDWFSAKDIPWADLLSEYRSCAWDGTGTPPSGADVISQLNGHVSYVDGRSMSVTSPSWPFEALGFTLFRTGHKLATHEHLREGGSNTPHAVLRTIVVDAKKAFETGDEMRLIEAVNAYALTLRQSGLTTSTTTDLLEQMRDNSDLFFAVKGCGAMGADVVLALHARSSAPDVFRWAAGRGLEVCGSLSTLSPGLEKLQDLHQGKHP